MVTRFCVGTNRPTQSLNLHVSYVSPLAKSYVDAFNDSNWQNAMNDEYNSFIKNNTWTLIPRPTEANVGVDVDETFSLVVKPGIIQTVLSLAISQHWPVHQLDRSLYCLKQAPRAWCHWTHVDTESKLGDDGDLVFDPTLYRSLAGPIQYLTFTRPDIFYVVHHVCLYMHNHREPHFSALKRIFSVEAEYRNVVNVVAETCWLRNLLRELHTLLSSTTLVYCDNVNVVYLSSNPVQHRRTKHIEIDIHFVRDLVAAGQVRVLHVPSCNQFADIFTNGLPSALFEEFQFSLSVRCPPAQTMRKC
uniref:Ribonuclease H-like domain-containing protein n=1 Tax=Tanacetum cinerariifolium TaxID=118510 RepID=A0A6L2K9R0_TANCI|nr:ribonuclease H-like domain-containing protein [Tanacetum cinerariifolium]